MSKVIYHEIQNDKPRFIYLVCAVLVLFAVSVPIIELGFGIPVSNNPLPDWGMLLMSAFIGLGVPALLLYSRMTLTVYDFGVEVEYRPFIKRRIFAGEITSADMVDYRGLAEYGGWGIRFRLLSYRNKAYTMSGHQGVMLKTIYGNEILLGTDRGDELLRAIQSIIG